MSLVEKIREGVKEAFAPEPNKPVVVLEGCDQLNRIVRLCQLGKKHWVEVNNTTIHCKTLKDAELEFEFRINDSNRNI